MQLKCSFVLWQAECKNCFNIYRKTVWHWVSSTTKIGARWSVSDSAWRWGAPIFTSHLPPWAHHHAIFILSRWDIHSGKQAEKVPAALQLSTCSTPADPCLSNPVVTIKTWYERGFLTNPPNRSKSKCAIKNAHLCSSTRLSNAYASYPREQEKWYRKWYRTPFIRYTIRMSSAGCWGWGRGGSPKTVWTLEKYETENTLVESHRSGCCLDAHLLNAANSFSSSTQNVKISWDERVRRERKTWCNAGDSPYYRQPTRRHWAWNYRWCKPLEIDWKQRKKSLSLSNDT